MGKERRLGIKEQIYYSLGCQTLSGTFFKFMKSHVMFLIFTTLPGVFINTFFMNLTDDTNVVMLYNAMNYVFAPIGMHLGTIVLRRYSIGACSITGVVLYNLFFILLLVLQTEAVHYYIPLGILIGLSGGFYYMSYGVLFSSYSTNENRDRASSFMSMASSVVSMLVPLISGAVISLFSDLWGYVVIFSLSLLVAMMTAFVIARLPVQRAERRKSQLWKCYKMVFQNKTWRLGMFLMMGLNIREGAFMFIMNIIVYQFINSEALVGFNTFLTACAGITAAFLMGRIVHQGNRTRAMTVAVTVITLTAVVYLFSMNVYTTMIFAVINAYFTCFNSTPVTNINLMLFDQMPGARGMWSELLSVRDIFVGSGRLISVLIIILSNLLTGGSLFWQGVVLVGLTAFQYVNILCAKRCVKNLEKLSQKQEEPCLER